MRRALLILAAISFSQLAAAQTVAGRADSGTSTEPQSPADASVPKDVAKAPVSKDVANQGAEKPAEEPKEHSAGAGGTIYATPLPPREPTDKQSEEQKPDEKQSEEQKPDENKPRQ